MLWKKTVVKGAGQSDTEDNYIGICTVSVSVVVRTTEIVIPVLYQSNTVNR